MGIGDLCGGNDVLNGDINDLDFILILMVVVMKEEKVVVGKGAVVGDVEEMSLVKAKAGGCGGGGCDSEVMLMAIAVILSFFMISERNMGCKKLGKYSHAFTAHTSCREQSLTASVKVIDLNISTSLFLPPCRGPARALLTPPLPTRREDNNGPPHQL